MSRPPLTVRSGGTFSPTNQRGRSSASRRATCTHNPERGSPRPWRRPACELPVQGHPAVRTPRSGTNPAARSWSPVTSVTSPNRVVSGKWRARTPRHAASISTAAATRTPARLRASSNPPTPANRLAPVSSPPVARCPRHPNRPGRMQASPGSAQHRATGHASGPLRPSAIEPFTGCQVDPVVQLTPPRQPGQGLPGPVEVLRDHPHPGEVILHRDQQRVTGFRAGVQREAFPLAGCFRPPGQRPRVQVQAVQRPPGLPVEGGPEDLPPGAERVPGRVTDVVEDQAGTVALLLDGDSKPGQADR